jgi:hypothetical protein
MQPTPSIQAYFEAKAGDVDKIDHYFAPDICIEDAGEGDIIKGFDNCKKWLKNTSQKYKMETKLVAVKNETNGITKVSVIVTGNFAPGNYPFDYDFRIIAGKIKSVKIIYMGA